MRINDGPRIRTADAAPSRRRGGTTGFTLVEVLASLSLLSAITWAGIAISQGVSRTAAARSAQLSWERAARALLESIAADVASGDIDAIGDRARADPRVRIEDGGSLVGVSLRTRDPGMGPCVRRYSVREGQVLVSAHPLTTPAQVSGVNPRECPALGDVRALVAALHGDQRLLVVRIEHVQGRHIERAFLLEPGVRP